ncbi:uncharacterized protein LOC103721807 isoform X6 [Phoenix dactylifera]|uniref:Uncharacterized protein LOC103721807 isoform X6 n=1 Tax=Phoenix dactylifera TaxID=42345 RepID=A0A8B9A5U7_PHODC|nr:uncharacterized protein LOC103721807 isoform X6 [Phoenix dactylifera]
MHPRVTSWILEFVLRQPVDDWVANGLLFALPLPSPVPPRLKKTLLLRRLSSDLSRPCLSGRTLLSLELIEELDRSAGADAPSDSLAAAYAAVAVECTACFLRERSDDDHGEDFFDAVNRIWNCRVADLERSEAAGLVSPALGEARREMEEAVVNPIVRVGLMGRDTKKAALDAVRVYLDEADKEMGPPYLERMAKAVGEEWRRSSRTGRDGSVVELYEILLNLLAIQGEHGRREGLPDGDRAKTSRFLEFDKHEESVLGRDKDAPEQGTGKGPYNDHDAMAHPSLMNQGPSDLEHVEENRERASLSFVDKGTKDGNPGTSTSTRDKKDCAGAPKPSLVDRNRTARTFEWDEDSIESPSENSPNSSNKLHFRSPKRREISLPLEDNKTFIKRRTKRKWSSLEEETLKKAVERASPLKTLVVEGLFSGLCRHALLKLVETFSVLIQHSHMDGLT